MIRQLQDQIQVGRRRLLRGVKGVKLSFCRLQQVPKWIRETVVISIAARAVTYAAIFIEWIFPSFGNKVVNWFWCPSYDNPMAAKWWVKYFSDNIAWFLISYVLCKISIRIGNYLFLVAVIFLGYHIIDLLMFCWNFQRYNLFYVDIFWTALMMIWTVFKGYKPETIAKIKSIF